MLKTILTTSLCTLMMCSTKGFSQGNGQLKDHVKQTINATRVDNPPKINGNLDDECWQNASIATNFLQFDPYHGKLPRFKTEIKVIYDDAAIYVGAFMHDPNPDSIFIQPGVRDNFDLNADYLFVSFDTYNLQQDAYHFGVTASGVQRDGREVDFTYSAVWESSVKIIDSGWVAEFRIPYSALRFPKTNIQTWGLQFIRCIKRYNEEYQWELVEKGSQNILNNWGRLTGLENINPPPRVSAAPYLAAGIQKNEDGSTSYSYNGGMDLKWGLNESFTVDMILMPDFSQVQSDKVVKNLTPFELEYDEKRQFFNEGTDLFQKGMLFYSRRIGRRPLKYNSVYTSLADNEIVKRNPLNAKLLNAVKLSGRNKNGLGIGVFNAVTGNTYATVKDTISSKEREILTDPVTNYNMLVVNQNLKNNSSFYVTNTNVWRPSDWRRSNVTGAGLIVADKTSTYQVNGDLSFTQNINPTGELGKDKNTNGLYYAMEIQKIKGKIRFYAYQWAMSKTYNRNDMGLNQKNDFIDRRVDVSYNSYKPGKIFNKYLQYIDFRNTRSLSTGKNENTQIKYGGSLTFNNYWKIGYELLADVLDRYDYYETRRIGSYVIKPGYTEFLLSLTSDSRKSVSLQSQIEISNSYDNRYMEFYYMKTNIRLNDRFTVTPKISVDLTYNDKGWVNEVNDVIIFGNRDLQTVSTSLATEFIVNNKLSLNLWLRHYWSRGVYDSFYTLENNGLLALNNEYNGIHDFNYNSFNLDLVFGWEFAPGSMINVVWKNAIVQENSDTRLDYFNNIEKLSRLPQTNNLSFKILYYLDYNMIKNLALKNNHSNFNG